MAQRTLEENIALYELRRDSLETKIEEHESYKALESQGRDGSRTEFSDPDKLYRQLEKINNKLANYYQQQG